MESNTRRRIRSGKEFDRLFPKPTGKDHRIKGSADVEDTLKLIRKTVPETLWQTEKIAEALKGRTLEQTCSNIWHFVYEHIQYKRDEDGVEQIRSPRRTWWERASGVDCDCYSEFISSILSNLSIPHTLRITKYPKKPPEVPSWQHIYPIVPIDGRLNRKLTSREDYIVMDCVKNDFDDEEPFIECKDYNMRLDYLDGIDQGDAGEEENENILERLGLDYEEPDSVDLADIASVYEGEEMGNIFKKIGKAVKKVADVHKKVITKSINVQKNLVKKVAEGHKKVIKAVAKKGVHFINRFTNPGTILLRNGFLLATKLNLFNIGGRMRYAYLTDAQAQERGINMDVLAKVRKVKDKAEKIYYDDGGNKSNFKKAVLKGRGNKKHNPVPLNGLGGFDDNIYADMQEYMIIHGDEEGLNGLGEIAAGASIAAAMAAVGAVAGALKQVKNLFSKGGKEEASFQSETDNAGTVAEAKGNIPESEDEVREDDGAAITSDDSPSFLTQAMSTLTPIVAAARTASSLLPNSSGGPQSSTPPSTQTETPYETPYTAEDTASYDTPASAAVPDIHTASGRNTTDVAKTGQTLPAVPPTDKQGFVEKTTGWIKENPGKSLAIAGAIAGTGYILVRSFGGNKAAQGLSGFTSGSKKRKYKKKPRSKSKKPGTHRPKNNTITFTKLL
jgi:hypothetical protein